MFSYPSPVVVVLAPLAIGFLLLDRWSLRDRSRVTAFLFLATVLLLAAFYLSRGILTGYRFDFLSGSLMSLVAFWAARRFFARMDAHEQSGSSAPETMSVPLNPAARIDEIDTAISRLQSERDRLAKRPDAHRP